MTSNIEPIAHEITRSICRDSKMPEIQIDQWVELHWRCAAVMLEVGLWMRRANGSKDKDWCHGLEAYRERLLASLASETTAIDNDPS